MNMAMTLPGGTPDPGLFRTRTPGVEVVGEDPRSSDALGVLAGRLTGALHRRLLPKFTVARRELEAPQRRWGHSKIVADPRVARVVDLTLTRVPDWSARLHAYATIAAEPDAGTTAVRVRGLHEDESSILVDGRPTPGCIVDLAVATTAFVDALRDGQPSLVIVHPEPNGACQVELWDSLVQLCQDRLGVERGVLRAVPSMVAAPIHAAV